ncbi:Rieske 2Fe-2S domain-containing protein [Verrucomicrobia bacterium]|jgi:nitrite reductase/ring-hydroxylating ferredoxin subunit|nr:Rieske 2Fe-2S domain-containing protein [Verrucomicrobiota bacterium]MDB4705256.1 Rieske 2Fe-2S domain-containing protein [Verrucomicrobiota bacterium]
MNLSRRTFVRTFLFNAAWMTGLGRMHRLPLLGELSPSPDGNQGILNVRPEDYKTLQEVGGSVRLGFNPIRSNHQPDGTLHPILINRLEDDSLIVLSAECPHASCAVRTFSKTSNTHSCPCHSSRFRLDGSRISGPSPFGLDRLDSEICPDGSLNVLVPRLKFSITSKVVDLGIFKRLQIDFAARRKVDYRVVFKAESNGEWQSVMFADSESGPLSNSVFTGGGVFKSVYVEPPSDHGMFAVQIDSKEL